MTNIEELGYAAEKPYVQQPLFTPQEKPSPQIAFLHGGNWGIISGRFRHAGIGLDKMPDVQCPIVDDTEIDDGILQKIKRKYISPYGASDISSLLEELIGAGGKILNSKRAA